MPSYLSHVINNTFGISGKDQIRPEFQTAQYTGFNDGADPFANPETSVTNADISRNDSTIKLDQESPSSPVERKEAQVRELPAPMVENTVKTFIQYQGVNDDEEGKIIDKQRPFQQKSEVITFISAKSGTDIPVSPIMKEVIPVEVKPVTRKEGTNSPPAETMDNLTQSPAIPRQMRQSDTSSQNTKRVKEMKEETLIRHKILTVDQVKTVEPDILSLPVIQQPPEKKETERERHDLQPNEPETSFTTAITRKQETRLVIGKLTVEVIQPVKEKNIPVPQPIVADRRPARSDQQKTEADRH